MNITTFFDRIAIVNLPERTDRRREMEQELKSVGLSLMPKKIEVFPAIRPTETAGFPSLGARGCFLSHLSILKQAKADGLANVLIMEDDLAISQQFQTDQASLLQQLQSDWGFAYFGHSEIVPELPTAKFQPFAGELTMTHFYAVNGNLFDRLIHYLDKIQQRSPDAPIAPMHLDGAYNHFRWDHPDVQTLITVPNLGWQRSSRSDIHPSWFDQVPVLRETIAAARSGKAWLQGTKAKG